MADADPVFRAQPDTRASALGGVVRRMNGKAEMIDLRWGLRPRDGEDTPFKVVRSEGREFPTNRCLVPASEFYYTHAGQRYCFTRADGEWFYFAGIWRPATRDWPESYAILTIEPNPDVAPYHHRQMAVIPRADRMAWLDFSKPEEELLRPLPAGTFHVELDKDEVVQGALAL